MNNSQFKIPNKLTTISLILIVIGIGAAVFGFINNPLRTWANYLICNYFFISLVIGATFFAALQRIAQAGWSAMFERIPSAMSCYLPYAAGFTLVLILFGSHHLYQWMNSDLLKTDELLRHKSAFLNSTFFSIRAVIILGSWIFFTRLLRKFSLTEDQVGGTENFKKSEFFSRVYLFVLALTFSLASYDWIMSIDYHWFSTLFTIVNLVSSFFHGSASVVLIVLLLHKMGYFPKLNHAHLRDLSKYMFMLSIMFGYVWFSQYFLTWYSNIPEETTYYMIRTNSEWHLTFISTIVFNWLFPFLFLLNNKIAENVNAMILTAVVLMVGFWIDIYMQVMPGVTGHNSIGFIELGMFLGFLGVFIFVVAKSLSKANIIPVNHPYLNESFSHKSH